MILSISNPPELLESIVIEDFESVNVQNPDRQRRVPCRNLHGAVDGFDWNWKIWERHFQKFRWRHGVFLIFSHPRSRTSSNRWPWPRRRVCRPPAPRSASCRFAPSVCPIWVFFRLHVFLSNVVILFWTFIFSFNFKLTSLPSSEW